MQYDNIFVILSAWRGEKNMNHDELKRKALNKKGVRAEYEALEPEFTLLKSLLSARKKAGLSQAEIAKRMGTKPPAITRLESSLTSGKHSPSLATLKKYVEVLGYRLEIRIVLSFLRGSPLTGLFPG